jgi:hypothetical protein
MPVKSPPWGYVATLAIWFVGTASGRPPFSADYSQLRTRPEMRRSLERQWEDDESTTEDMRIALRRCRTFFDRLLSL